MPLNKNAKLTDDVLDLSKVAQAPTRDGFGNGLAKEGEKNSNIVVLCADLSESTRSLWFQKKFPDRFLECGVAEQNMASVASGMAAMGKIPFISSYAMFSPGRNWEQIRTTICYNRQNVKIGGAHAGVSVGPDGATHQAIEDIAIMRVIPNMTVLVPADSVEAEKATIAAARINGPVYVRFAREKTPIFTTLDTPFEVGRAEVFWDSEKPEVALISCGPMVHNAVLAADMLEKEGISSRVINLHTIKPMDEKEITRAAKDAGAIVTVEEHQIMGGLGSAIAEVLAKNYPTPMEFMGIQDRFGESGEPNELIEYFGLMPKDIVEAAKRVIKRKK
ncbi:MAG: transketolase family protein [Candidatus Niyogibacteria bacterium]|nr:transketolase family protein [Candidatus Niyogibacteria bacterium]